MVYTHTFLPKPTSVTFVIPDRGHIQIRGVGTRFSTQLEPGNLLRVVQRLRSGPPGVDLTVTIKSVQSDTLLTIEEESLPGSGGDLTEDLLVDSFLGYKRSVPQKVEEKAPSTEDVLKELKKRVDAIEKQLKMFK